MAKYKLFDIVKFKNFDEVKQGEILAVNDFFGNIEKPDYEIYVENEKCLYKEVKEAYIVELVKENKEKYDAYDKKVREIEIIDETADIKSHMVDTDGTITPLEN